MSKKKITTNKKGSMLLENMLLMVIGLIVLAAFNSFLSAGKNVVNKSAQRIQNMEHESDSRSTLGTFTKK